ncbi:MAG: peptide deformylase [Pseudomonadota bacterium]
MALLPIVTVPDPMLRETSAPIEQVDDQVRALIDDMLETMYDAPGIGLAAVQVGVLRRLIVVDIGEREDAPPDPIAMINPEIVQLGDTTRVYEEGCLSLPDVLVDVERPETAVVRYVDREGVQQERELGGLLATVVLHEVDHLDGRLIIDSLSRLKREMVVRKLKKLARA